MRTKCPVKGCDLPELHSFVKVSADGSGILHLHDPDPDRGRPMRRLILWLERRHRRNTIRYATTHRSSAVTTRKRDAA